ncbi:MAG TPA: PDR/VanB family oxidoreductase [Stellaceae bacterium]|nr:PDR/VanB family oxidoreductase [Stellaceae bacterium]
MSDLELVVSDIRALTPAIKRFELRGRDGGALPPFTAGAHIDVAVTLPNGAPGSRSYSLVNSPIGRDRYEIAVLREPQGSGGSAFMHERVQIGDRLAASAPRNDFPLAGEAREHWLIAGGIGITPILAMARVLAASGQPFALHYCARSPETMVYREEIAALAGDRARFYFDGGDPARGLDVGALLAAPMPGRHVYVCGPRGMIDAVLTRCQRSQWPRDQVHFELFTPAKAEAGDQAFEVVLARSGRSVRVAAGKTILETLLEVGEEPLSDCRRGECGVCVTEVLAGEPLHRDYYLTDSEKAAGKSMCICVSRARGAKLVLDL